MSANGLSLRARCDAVLRTLDVPRPFNIQSFCAALEARRGRPIVLRPMRTGVGLCGLWIPIPTYDLILYEEQTSPLHQTHIVLHELSHLLLDHQPKSVDDPDVVRLVLPDLSPGMVRFVLERTTYSAEEEKEAELLASLIVARMIPTELHPRPRDGESAQLLHRLSSALEDPPGAS